VLSDALSQDDPPSENDPNDASTWTIEYIEAIQDDDRDKLQLLYDYWMSGGDRKSLAMIDTNTKKLIRKACGCIGKYFSFLPQPAG